MARGRLFGLLLTLREQLGFSLVDTGADDLAAVAGLLSDRARLLAAQAAAGGPEAGTNPYPASGGREGAPGLATVRLAGELGTLTAAALRLAVERAHASGHTWQEISEPLGVSPQAAFQRFGRPDGPAAGEPMTPVISDAVPLVFESGVMKGRVVFDRAGQVAGLYVLPPATP